LAKLDNAAVTPEEKSEALKMNITESDIINSSPKSQHASVNIVLMNLLG